MSRRVTTWTRFEVAPKDGREILVYYIHQHVYLLVSFNLVHGQWESKSRPLLSSAEGLVWMDLPECSAECPTGEERSRRGRS